MHVYRATIKMPPGHRQTEIEFARENFLWAIQYVQLFCANHFNDSMIQSVEIHKVS